MLGVNDKPVSEQWHPVMAWLEHNEASRELWMSLLANGYGYLLEQKMPSFNRPVPRQRITSALGRKTNLLIWPFAFGAGVKPTPSEAGGVWADATPRWRRLHNRGLLVMTSASQGDRSPRA